MAYLKVACPGIIIASCALLLQCALGATLQASSCDFTTMSSLRSEWGSSDDPCQQKMSFELWTFMKAEGSAQRADAQDVRANCLMTKPIELIELITPKGYTMSDALEAAPGNVVSETEHATTYNGATAAAFEGFCEDENIVKVTRVEVTLDSRMSTPNLSRRRLQSSTSEAGNAHQVAELIAGLKDLGCTRTTGEDQTLCVMSDSFDYKGNAVALQSSGDLPDVEVVKELAAGSTGTDEGSAMIELAYDIAGGATYKFNTAFDGQQAFADDIIVLATEEGCDVIVDDVSYRTEPAFVDGPVADAVDAAVAAGSLYFSSAGNYATGHRFTSDFECTTDFMDLGSTATCGDGFGFPSHVFQPEATGIRRYFFTFDPTNDATELFLVRWDAPIDTDQDIEIFIYYEDLATGEVFLLSVHDYISGGLAYEGVLFEPRADSSGLTYHLQIVLISTEVWNADFHVTSNEGLGGYTDGSMFGHACASSCVAVAAVDWDEATGPGGAFADPETAPVESFSSRGPCIVSGEARSKPTTCAADSLTTSTPGFADFSGTSAAAPVAAAIATIVRAACFPTVVGYADIMEMLTNYDYTIDYTSDAGGAAETWGIEAGHGIISASQMLAWIEANCGNSCPGSASSPTAGPVDPPAPAPVAPGVPKPTTDPAPVSVPPTPTPTFVHEPKEPEPSQPPSTPPTTAPAPMTPAEPLPPTSTPAPVEPTTPAPMTPAEPLPTTIPPAAPEDDIFYVEAGTKTGVHVFATAWDERPGEESGDVGCGAEGCVPALAYDGLGETDPESRWSCKTDIVPDGGPCQIEFTFDSPQHIMDVQAEFWKANDRTRTLKVSINGNNIGEFESDPGSVSTSFGINQEDVHTVTLESTGIDDNEWISVLEVHLLVEA